MKLSEAAARRVRLTQAELRAFPSLTVGEWVKKGVPEGARLFVDTFRGIEEVDHIRWPETDPWLVCGRGFDQRSYCVHYDVNLWMEMEA